MSTKYEQWDREWCDPLRREVEKLKAERDSLGIQLARSEFKAAQYAERIEMLDGDRMRFINDTIAASRRKDAERDAQLEDAPIYEGEGSYPKQPSSPEHRALAERHLSALQEVRRLAEELSNWREIGRIFGLDGPQSTYRKVVDLSDDMDTLNEILGADDEASAIDRARELVRSNATEG